MRSSTTDEGDSMLNIYNSKRKYVHTKGKRYEAKRNVKQSKTIQSTINVHANLSSRPAHRKTHTCVRNIYRAD